MSCVVSVRSMFRWRLHWSIRRLRATQVGGGGARSFRGWLTCVVIDRTNNRGDRQIIRNSQATRPRARARTLQLARTACTECPLRPSYRCDETAVGGSARASWRTHLQRPVKSAPRRCAGRVEWVRLASHQRTAVCDDPAPPRACSEPVIAAIRVLAQADQVADGRPSAFNGFRRQRSSDRAGTGCPANHQ